MKEYASPLRYPGGKAFLAGELKRIIEAMGSNKPVYVEPYAGGAGAALSLLFSNRVESIVINDLDEAIYSFWKAVVEEPERFARKIISTPVQISEWEKQRKIYLNKKSKIFERGFATFFLNRTNRSGVMNAWPIGGLNQKGNYKINARYNKSDLVKRILKIGKYKHLIKVVRQDGIELTKKYLLKKKVFIYLDPPYFQKGAMLYLNHYKPKDHKGLAQVLNQNFDSNWVLTYDKVPEIQSLYAKRKNITLDFKYRVHDSSKVQKAQELMIFSKSIADKILKKR